MIGNTLAALVGLPIKGPEKLRPVVVPVVGVMFGSSVTMALFSRMEDWVLTLLLLPVVLISAAAISYSVYRRIGGYDPATAFYAAMPGGLNEMLIMGEAAGADDKRIALAHAARILIVIFCVVLFFWLVLDVTSTGNTDWIGLFDIGFVDYLILGFCAIAGVWIGQMLGLPAAPVFGPMMLSGIAHVFEWVAVAPPTIFIIIAQGVVGTIIGARFVGTKPSMIFRDLGLALVSAIGMLIVASVFAELIALQTGISLSQAFLAYAPGGLTEMSLLSLAMAQDVTYVSVMHLIRITIVIAIAPYLFSKLLGRPSKGQ